MFEPKMKKRIKIGDTFTHRFYGLVTVTCIQGTAITFRYEGNNENTQHNAYFLKLCGKIELDVYIPAFRDTIFNVLENKENYIIKI
jgi:hypothetical protein